LLTVLSNPAFAEFDQTEWPFLKELEMPSATDAEHAYAYFQVDAEICDGTMGVLNSLRVVDFNNNEIPYQIVTKGKSTKTEELPSKLLNNSYLDGKYNSFVLDFGEERPEVNRLTILTGSKNFTRSVSVEGSNDQAQWNTLVEDFYIFDFSRNIRSRHSRVEFPRSNFRYLLVKILDDGAGPLEIDGAKAYRVKTERAETESWPFTVIERTENGEDRTTEVLLDAGYFGLPITLLDLEIPSRNYHRNVRVEASKDLEKWTQLGSRVIFNYDMPAFKKSNTRLSFRQNPGCRYFRLTIENYDDKPIEVSAATGTSTVRRIVLPLKGREPHTVFFGAPKAKAPRYDFAHRMRYIQTNTLPRLSLQSRKSNPDYVKPTPPAKPMTERHPALLWVVMGTVMVVLALLILSLMRKAPPESKQE
jgi:hypothetical protein